MLPYFYDPIGEYTFVIPADVREYDGDDLRTDADTLAYIAQAFTAEFPEADADWYVALVSSPDAPIFGCYDPHNQTFVVLESGDSFFRMENVDVLENKVRNIFAEVDDIVREQNEMFGSDFDEGF